MVLAALAASSGYLNSMNANVFIPPAVHPRGQHSSEANVILDLLVIGFEITLQDMIVPK